jgi:ketosteroid isomerase-like protein
MSSENIDLIKRGLDAFNRGDFPAVLELVAEDVEVQEESAFVPEPERHTGRSYMRQWFDGLMRNWEEFEVEPQEFIEGGAKVIAVSRVRGVGRKSGAEVEGRFAYLFEVRDGRVVRMHFYRDRDDALADLRRNGHDADG